MAKRPQVKAITKNLTMLIESIDSADNKLTFASGLAEEGFIESPDAFKAAGIPFSERVASMIRAVQSKIKFADAPQQLFEKFIKIVAKVDGGIAERVTKTYSKTSIFLALSTQYNIIVMNNQSLGSLLRNCYNNVVV